MKKLLQRSKLDEVYSLSGKMTCKEMISQSPHWIGMSQLTPEMMKYVDIYTSKVKDSISIRRNKCPLCDSQDFVFLFEKHGFDHVLCNSCDLIFTLQILDTTKIDYLGIGKEGDDYGVHKEDRIVSELDRKKFTIVFEEIEKYIKIKNIFDFGSQSGTFLDWAKQKYSIIGHEYHTPLRNAAIRKGHTVLNDNLEKIELDQEVDLITCWDYIDHVLNPKEVIKNLSKFLKKDGIFFFAINNRDSLSSRIMHKDAPQFIGPHHTMHYGIDQLKILMNDYNLLYAESYVSELNWVSNWLSFKNPEEGDSPLMFNLFDPAKICELGMGIKLNAIFKKK